MEEGEAAAVVVVEVVVVPRSENGPAFQRYYLAEEKCWQEVFLTE